MTHGDIEVVQMELKTSCVRMMDACNRHKHSA
jgi:hypothetical protein